MVFPVRFWGLRISVILVMLFLFACVPFLVFLRSCGFLGFRAMLAPLWLSGCGVGRMGAGLIVISVKLGVSHCL